MLRMNKAYAFCKEFIDKDTTPRYVKRQMRDFMNICEDKNKKYVISQKKVKQVEDLLYNHSPKH